MRFRLKQRSRAQAARSTDMHIAHPRQACVLCSSHFSQLLVRIHTVWITDIMSTTDTFTTTDWAAVLPEYGDLFHWKGPSLS
jgi:hypothetical protein